MREIEKPQVLFQLKRELRRFSSDKKVRNEVKLRNEVHEQAGRISVLVEGERKRKAEKDKVWEDTREERVGGWRKFTKKLGKKKKKDEWD